jgi:hypothetical protein
MNKNKSVVPPAYLLSFPGLTRPLPPRRAAASIMGKPQPRLHAGQGRSGIVTGFFFLKKTDQSGFISKPIHFLMECTAPGFVIFIIIRI